MNANDNEIDLADDLEIERPAKRDDARGTWVSGSLNGHVFQALVFPEHAENPDYEYEQSQISKLWVRRIADREVVFNFDRGMDIDAKDELTKRIVDFLAAGLAEHTFGC